MAINNLTAQLPQSPVPTDPTTLAVYNDIYGTTPSLASLAAEFTSKTITPLQALTDMSNNFSLVSSQLQNLLSPVTGTGDLIDWFHTQYPNGRGEPPVTPPTGLSSAFSSLASDLQTLQLTSSSDPTYMTVLQRVVTDFNTIDTILKNNAGSLDAYGTFLSNFMDAWIDSSGTVSLSNLVTSIVNAGGVSKDSLGASELATFLTGAGADPNPSNGTLSNELLNWIQGILNGLEF